MYPFSVFSALDDTANRDSGAEIRAAKAGDGEGRAGDQLGDLYVTRQITGTVPGKGDTGCGTRQNHKALTIHHAHRLRR